MQSDELLERDFGSITELVRAHARERPHARALIKDARTLTYGELDALVECVAASLQRDGVRPGETIAISALSSVEYAVVFLGALRAGVAVAPLAPSSTPDSFATMLADSRAKALFLDRTTSQTFGGVASASGAKCIALEADAGELAFDAWLAPAGVRATPVTIDPEAPFNIIYSSGTTGVPKGIVQSHLMRWQHVRRARASNFDKTAVVICSTPLYSNTTLVCFFPALAGGGAVVLMSKFDAAGFCALAEKHRATHAMLVPVQYQRIMDLPDFDRYDLGSFRMKFCTSAPFPAALKADVLKRWPGGLTEYYGMTEGGGTCVLYAHQHPDKLHTVGQPAPGHDIRLIDESGREVSPGEVGEVVGRSPAMMNGYFNQPDKTAEAEWRDSSGNRYIRTGDVGRFDADGFLVLMDRRKDMIISGGFNIYPSDLEGVLCKHEAVKDAAVVGAPSREWGETPVAFVVLKENRAETAEDIRSWANSRLGKTQRLSAVVIAESLPRSAIGKVLKRELRERYTACF